MDEWWGAFSKWLTGTSDMRQWDWGSTADWVTGLLTASAVLIAALTLTHERSRERKAHAKYLQVNQSYDLTNGRFVHTVDFRNLSEKPFFDLKIILPAEDGLLDDARREWRKLMVIHTRGMLSEVRKGRLAPWLVPLQVYRISLHMPRAGLIRYGELDADTSAKYQFDRRKSGFFLYVSFKDSAGNEWMYNAERRRFVSNRRSRKIYWRSKTGLNPSAPTIEPVL